MRTCIATVCLSGTLEDKLRACAAAGFDGVEIFEPDLVVSPLSPEEVGRLCADLGLSIDLYQPVRDLEGVDEAGFAASLRRLERVFATMTRLGADTVLMCSNVATATTDDDAVVVDQLRRLGDLAAAHGKRIAYEALAWGTYVDDYERAWQLVQAADHPAVGTCLDSFHILSRGADPAGIEAIPADKIFFLQLADAPALQMDVLSWSRHHRVFPGQGAWDLPAFLAHVMRAGYTGPVSLEVFNDTFRQGDEERTAVDAWRSLRWLEDRTATLLRREGVQPPVELRELPAVDDPSGFDFVEIRCDDAAQATQVGELLRTLGFTDSGRHRTKAVHLWTLGDARICVNVAPTRGGRPELAAVGFLVDDPGRAARRAEQLASRAVPRDNAADEEVLRAVEAPDGTEVFFGSTGQAWIEEFGDGEDAAEAPAAPGAAVDHVNLAQPWQHYDEGVLFFASALSLDPQASLDVASPVGLVRSQVVQTADKAVRLALNLTPPITHSTSGERDQAPALALRHAQHIAISCPDLVSFARRARERGLDFLAIPDNYYENIAAQFDLDEDTLATLRELNLLYDRDATGEFLHFYTATIGDVFLEVVERRDGYAGFGAPNAPVRLATQFARRRTQ